MQCPPCLRPCPRLPFPAFSNCLLGLILVGTSGLFACRQAGADEPLHERIDQQIESSAVGPLAEPSDDSEFFRRICLDLLGRIPKTNETRAFLADASPDKRQQAIDQLLASDEATRHLTEVFDLMLMERRGEHAEWSKYLRQAFQQNKPWDQLVRELLSPDVESEETRGSAFFISKRLEKYGQNPVDMPGLVRDVGRLLLGIDVQCAQCHDHLFIDDYKQVDYQGLFAYLGHTSIRADLDFPAVAEALVEQPVEFTSVFELESRQTGPRLPGGREIEIPKFAKDEAYEVPPDRKTRHPGVPRFRPLQTLAQELPQADNRLFTRNIANRLWWLMMGRGLVHPLDLHHAGNPASHPELLDLLADELAAHQFDLRWMIRQLALSRAYQRGGRLPEVPGQAEAADPAVDRFQVALEKPMSAEQMLDSVLVATGQEPRPITTESARDPFSETLLKDFRDALAGQPKEPETEIRPSVKGALFLSNSETITKWTRDRDGNLAARLEQIEDSDRLAEELYLSVLSRLPESEEREEVDGYLRRQADRRGEAISHLIWSLLTSTEFCVNH